MTRTEDLANALEEIQGTKIVSDNDLKQIEISILAHIAMALAEIADTLRVDKEGSKE